MFVGRTMLDLACSNGHTECVETLLLQGATILVHDNISRRTPLHSAGKLKTYQYQWYFYVHRNETCFT